MAGVLGGLILSAAEAAVAKAGYFAGGNDSTNTYLSGIDKILFSADTKSTLAATLTSINAGPYGAANSGTAGYVAGGGNAGFARINSIEKLSFSAETTSTLSTTLPTDKEGNACASDSGVI